MSGTGIHAKPVAWSGRRFGGAVAIACSFAVLTAWSWRKWPDVLVDFGRELYVPWQLSAGKTLYTDLAYFNGPLSPYLNSLWFNLFGVSLSTLIFCNLAILALTTVMIYRLFAETCDRLTATVCCLVFMTVFGFAHLVETGNYNFVTPYSHELTHGIALSTAMILCLWSYARKRRPWKACVAGLLLGMVFLTKAEVFLAALTAAAAGLALLYVTDVDGRQKTLAAACLALGTALVPTALFLVFFGQHMSFTESFTRILGAWTFLLGSDVTSNLFYQRSLGLDEPVARLVMAARAFTSIVLLISAAIVADALSQLRPRFKAIAVGISVTLFVLSCVAKLTADPWLGSIWLPVPWLMLGAALPLVSVFTCSFCVCFLLGEGRVELRRLLPFAMWSCFALVLLAKIILTARLYHYGFALAMPATLVLTSGLVYFVPKILQNRYGEGGVFRRFIIAMLIADALFFLKVSNRYYSSKTMTVASGGDAIVAARDVRGALAHRGLSRIESVMPARASMMVLPEGIMLNYLSRRINPTPFTNFMPPELAIFGEATMLTAIQQHPPDFILIVPKDTGEYGVGPFGVDPNYGRQIMQWVDTNYSRIEEVHADTPEASIQIMKRDTRGLGAR